MPVIKSEKELREIVEEERGEGHTIVTTNGCFDIVHAGHVYYLRKAAELGGVLILGLNSDESVKKIKEAGRPVNLEKDRIEVVEALDPVDYVYVFDSENPAKFLSQVKPNIHVKGADYKYKNVPEQKIVEDNNGKIKFIDYRSDISTTIIINRIKETCYG